MRILFFGIYGQGMASLQRLVEHNFNVVGVVTKPNTDSEIQPVAQWAASKGIAVLQPASAKSDEFAEQVRQLEPDLIVVSGYHLVLPKRILDIPARGAINLHGSLLPKYRGPNPYKWAIIKGEAFTGATVHVMTPRLDDGDILAQRTIPIARDDNNESLFQKTSLVGAELLVETLENIQRGTVKRQPQEESQASYYSYPTEQDTQIDWTAAAATIDNLVRGLCPRPGAWAWLNDRKYRVKKVVICEEQSAGPPGRIVSCTEGRVRITTSTFDLLIEEMILDEPAG